MADDGTLGEPPVALVQEILSAIPSGCTWLLPVTGDNGEVVDFTVAATSDQVQDLQRRGASRRHARLSRLYPSMVGGPLWSLYQRVFTDGVPAERMDFDYEDHSAGVVAHSRFVVTVHRALGGLLVWW